MLNRIETVILSNIFTNDVYARKVLPFLKEEYFSDITEKLIFETIKDFTIKYNDVPTKESVIINISQNKTLNDSHFQQVKKYISEEINVDSNSKLEWLLDETEKWCKDRAIYNAVRDSIVILDDGGKGKTRGDIPKLLSDALSVCFDTQVGHDYVEDADSRFDYYHRKVEKYSFDIDYLNKITGGGVEPKTLNIILAGTGVGKSMFMCHFAGHYLMQGLNVLYITLEMAQEKIAERIDANLMNIDIDKIRLLPKPSYDSKIGGIRSRTEGKLVIKEYPTAMANANHFRHLITELEMKRKFKPDVIFVDYLNIASSCRVTKISDSYGTVKSIAEELRGLAVEQGVPIWTATQTNRAGFNSTDVGLENTSESFGIPATADFMFALMANDELKEMNQVLVKQLKNRYGDPTLHKRFVVGVDGPKMRLYNLEQSAQEELHDYSGGSKEKDDKPAFDQGTFGRSERNDGPGEKLNWEKFGKFK